MSRRTAIIAAVEAHNLAHPTTESRRSKGGSRGLVWNLRCQVGIGPPPPLWCSLWPRRGTGWRV
jgi:hypothetical protein